MISKKTLSYYARYTNFARYFKISPIWWSKETQTWSSELNYLQNITWRLAGFHCIVYYMYLILRFITEVKNGSENYIELSIILQFSIGYLWASLGYYNLHNKKEDMVTFYTHLITFDTLLEGWLRQVKPKASSRWTISKIIELTVLLYILQFFSLLALLTLMFLVTFRSRAYIMALLSSSDLSIETMLMFLPFEILSKMVLLYPIFFIGSYMQIYTFAIPYWLDVLSSTKKDAVKMIPMFKKLSVLNAYFNRSLNSGYIPVKYTSLGVLIVGPVFASIRLFGRVHWGTFLILPACGSSCLVGSTLIIYAATLVYERSLYFIQTLRRNYRMGPLARRYSKSLKPFGVQVGVLRAAKYLYLFAFYLSVSNYIISLLISYPASYF